MGGNRLFVSSERAHRVRDRLGVERRAGRTTLMASMAKIPKGDKTQNMATL
jgi:hypothetical protein